MEKIVAFFWSVLFTLLFRCATLVFAITKTRIRGSLVAVWSKGRILLIKKSYRKAWSVPGGLLKRGETWEQAAVRELFEEVGIHIKEDTLAYVTEVSGDLGPHDRARLFQVEIKNHPAIRIDRREISAAEFVAPQEALKRVLDANLSMYLSRHPHN